MFSLDIAIVYLASELLYFCSEYNSNQKKKTHKKTARLTYSLKILMTNRLVRWVHAAELAISHRYVLYTKPTNHKSSHEFESYLKIPLFSPYSSIPAVNDFV